MNHSALARHRGPFSLMVVRPSKGRTPVRTEWLRGVVSRADLAEEAESLLTDPRDTIIRVHAWSEKDNQFALTFDKQEVL